MSVIPMNNQMVYFRRPYNAEKNFKHSNLRIVWEVFWRFFYNIALTFFLFALAMVALASIGTFTLLSFSPVGFVISFICGVIIANSLGIIGVPGFLDISIKKIKEHLMEKKLTEKYWGLKNRIEIEKEMSKMDEVRSSFRKFIEEDDIDMSLDDLCKKVQEYVDGLGGRDLQFISPFRNSSDFYTCLNAFILLQKLKECQKDKDNGAVEAKKILGMYRKVFMKKDNQHSSFTLNRKNFFDKAAAFVKFLGKKRKKINYQKPIENVKSFSQAEYLEYMTHIKDSFVAFHELMKDVDAHRRAFDDFLSLHGSDDEYCRNQKLNDRFAIKYSINEFYSLESSINSKIEREINNRYPNFFSDIEKVFPELKEAMKKETTVSKKIAEFVKFVEEKGLFDAEKREEALDKLGVNKKNLTEMLELLISVHFILLICLAVTKKEDAIFGNKFARNMNDVRGAMSFFTMPNVEEKKKLIDDFFMDSVVRGNILFPLAFLESVTAKSAFSENAGMSAA